MLLNGKKGKRVMLRVSEEMWQQINALCELEHRSQPDQIRFLMAAGLSQAWARAGNGMMESSCQQTSALTFAEEEAKSPRAATVSKRQQIGQRKMA